ncbi:hypothetical protein Nizo2264_1064 [Lactiplantibacillus plantarum]|nr:hypothetical protein Nizo2264_1064 [Lactiplantibacillus plantarum]
MFFKLLQAAVNSYLRNVLCLKDKLIKRNNYGGALCYIYLRYRA